jgi:hypothetical protein
MCLPHSVTEEEVRQCVGLTQLQRKRLDKYVLRKRLVVGLTQLQRKRLDKCRPHSVTEEEVRQVRIEEEVRQCVGLTQLQRKRLDNVSASLSYRGRG